MRKRIEEEGWTVESNLKDIVSYIQLMVHQVLTAYYAQGRGMFRYMNMIPYVDCTNHWMHKDGVCPTGSEDKFFIPPEFNDGKRKPCSCVCYSMLAIVLALLLGVPLANVYATEHIALGKKQEAQLLSSHGRAYRTSHWGMQCRPLKSLIKERVGIATHTGDPEKYPMVTAVQCKNVKSLKCLPPTQGSNTRWKSCFQFILNTKSQ